MTDTDAISTPEEFNTALIDLLIAGFDAGIDVSGAWECRGEDGADDWEVIVTALAGSDGGP